MNQTTATVRLYTSLGCHLCEQAEMILSEVLNPDEIIIEKVEIADSDDLIERYGVRIPVLGFVKHDAGVDGGAELGWPFDHQQVIDFLSPLFKSE